MASLTIVQRIARRWYGAGLGKPGLREKTWMRVLDELSDNPKQAIELIRVIKEIDSAFPEGKGPPAEEVAPDLAQAMARLTKLSKNSDATGP